MNFMCDVTTADIVIALVAAGFIIPMCCQVVVILKAARDVDAKRDRLRALLADISDGDVNLLTRWPDDRLDQLATADGLHRAYDWCELRQLDPWRDYSGGVERTDELYAWLDPATRRTVVTEKIYAAQYNRMRAEKRRLAQFPKI